MEEHVEHGEENDVLDCREGRGGVDSLAYLHELHQHEEGQDGLGNRYDEGLVDRRHHVPDLRAPEKGIKRARDGRV